MGCMGISDLAIIRCVFHINAAKKKSRFIILILISGKIIDAVASLNPPVGTKYWYPSPQIPSKLVQSPWQNYPETVPPVTSEDNVANWY